MYNNFDSFNNPVHTPAYFPTIEPILPTKTIYCNGGIAGRYENRFGEISAPMGSFLQNKKVDGLGNICWNGGLSTGLSVDFAGQLRDGGGNLINPTPAINPLLNPRVF